VAGTAQMQVCNDGGWAGCSWEPYQSSRSWTITAYGEYVVPRVVYVRFQDVGGTISATYQDDIILDVNAPTGSVRVVPIGGGAVGGGRGPTSPSASSGQAGPAGQAGGGGRAPGGAGEPRNVRLDFSATDDVSGVADMMVSASPTMGGATWQPYTTTMTWVMEGNSEVYVRYRDRAGNASDAVAQENPPPVVTWPNPAGIVYGTPLGATQLNATANVPGSFVYTPPSGTVLSAGTGQTLSVTFTPTDPGYLPVPTTVTVDVSKATPVITWANPASITAGTPLSGTQLNATASFGGSPVEGTFVYTPPATTVLPVGAGQTLSVLFTPTDTANYTTATASVSIDVTSSSAPTFTDPTLTAGATPVKAVHITQLRTAIATLRARYGLLTVAWTDGSLVAGTTSVKAVHITELRTAIAALRVRYGLGAASWTDASLVAGVTPVKVVHVTELRTALQEVYVAAGRAVPTYTHATLTAGTTVVTAVDITELRAAIVAIW